MTMMKAFTSSQTHDWRRMPRATLARMSKRQITEGVTEDADVVNEPDTHIPAQDLRGSFFL